MINKTKIRHFLYRAALFPSINHCSVCGAKSLRSPRFMCQRNRDVHPECLYARDMPKCNTDNAPIPLLIWQVVTVLFVILGCGVFILNWFYPK